MQIPQIFKYCFLGYGQYTIFRTKAEAKSYLKNNSVIHRIKDLFTITDELRQKISDTPRHDVFEIIDNIAVPLENEMIEDTRSDEEIREQLWNDDDSAEVAEEKHYAEMAKFFDENVMDIAFSPYLPFCSKCGKPKPDYVGMMKFSDITLMPITFAFCAPCRDALTHLRIQRTQSPERFGV